LAASESERKKKMLALSFIIFGISVLFIIFLRPSFLVDEETREWKSFGSGSNKSYINITVIVIFCAVFSYLISVCLTGMCSKIKLVKQDGGGQVVPATPTPLAVPVQVAPPPLIEPISNNNIEFPAFDLHF
jgi:hypothetical protein